MSMPYDEVKDFWDYLLFYPEEDEEGFDGIHFGGISGMKENAPDEAVKAYEEYMRNQKEYRKKNAKV